MTDTDRKEFEQWVSSLTAAEMSRINFATKWAWQAARQRDAARIAELEQELVYLKDSRYIAGSILTRRCDGLLKRIEAARTALEGGE